MLDSYLKRKDVLEFIDTIKNNPRFYRKTIIEKVSFGKHLDNELALYVFYDALFKYRVIIDDDSLFNFYFDQVKKIYLKLDRIEDIEFGINKAICRVCASYLEIVDIGDKVNRDKLIKFIYDKYIINGYYVHGFNTVYEDAIKRNGFLSNVYENFYYDMNKVQEIFNRYGINNIMNKNFSSNITYFTDNFVMGCYYSVNSPGYFYNLLFNEEVYGRRVNRSAYLTRNYRECVKNIKKVIRKFNRKDSKYILEVVKKEWNYLNQVTKRISLLVVKRNIFGQEVSKLDEFLKSDNNIYEIVDGILSPKLSKVRFNDVLYDNKFDIISLSDYYDVYVKEERKKNTKLSTIKDMNAYGVASLLIICGCMAISLGVLITIIMIVGGI